MQLFKEDIGLECRYGPCWLRVSDDDDDDPHLLFGVEMYANTGITHLSKLMTLNNKVLRILPNNTYSTPVKELYADYNTLPVPQLHKNPAVVAPNGYFLGTCLS